MKPNRPNKYKTKVFTLLISLILLGCNPEQSSNMKITYPVSKIDNTIIDDYHGEKIADPYRWLEDDHSEATLKWVDDQNQVTFDYLKSIPFRSAIRERLEELWNYERVSAPFKEGDRIYYFKNDGLQNQAILYEKKKAGTDDIIIDPNTLSEDGTTSVGGYSFSNDGKFLAYQVSEGGSDWQSIFIKNLETGKVLNDKVEWVKFSSASWYKDGFYYSRYPAPDENAELSGRNTFHKLYYHKIGTDQSEDVLIQEQKDSPNRGVFASVTEDEKYLSVGFWESTSGNALYFRSTAEEKLVPIFEEIKHDFNLVGNIGDQLLIMTNHKADNNRLIAVDTNHPEQENWKEIIPESNDKLNGISLLGGKIVANYIHNASTLIKIFDENGKFIKDLALPGIGTVGGFSGKQKDNTAYFTFTSYTRPATIYELDMTSLESKLFISPKTQFDASEYETHQVWYSSKDGTKIPMFITHKKGMKLDGTNPTLLYGYGGFNISLLPSFSIQRSILLENGGVLVVANLRGGGEFGKKWHLAGTKERKQNVFDDFHGAAEYLIENKYTSSEKLAIQGGSNGGLLVGAAITQRPDLYKVAFPAVGVLDMLRYDKFTIGRAWSEDYGLSEDADAFKILKAYSPLHNVKDISYPATMITTADHDDRVVPAHSFKFAATLQQHQQGNEPTLIRIDKSAGHGAGKPTSKQIDEAADIWSFMFYNMGETFTQP